MRSERTRNPSRAGDRVALPAALAVALVMVVQTGAGAHPHHDEYVDKLDQGMTERVSVSSSGAEADADSGRTGCGEVDTYKYQASDNGRFVTFSSRAGNLHPADVNGQVLQDVFAYDRKKNKTHLVSAMPDGLAPEVPTSVDVDAFPCAAGSFSPAISGNGRFVAFKSDLPLTGTEGAGSLYDKIFVRDLKKGTTELVSRTWNGDPPIGSPIPQSGFSGLSISDDGRFVAFHSNVTNLTETDPCVAEEILPGVPGALSTCNQVYVRDRARDQTFLVSRSSDGAPGNGEARWPIVSGNGRYVAFDSEADNLVAEEIDSCPGPLVCSNVFIRDLRRETTRLVSVSRDGGGANRSFVHDITDDGRFVVYASSEPNHVPANFDPVCGGGGTYLRDLEMERTERISVTSSGTMLAGWEGSISDDGRYAAVHPWWDQGSLCNVPPVGLHSYRGAKLLDRHTGQADWRSFVNAFGVEGADEAPFGAGFSVDGFSTMTIGGNGRFVLGPAEGSNMVHNDRNDAVDMFVREIGRYPLGLERGDGPSDTREPPDDSICVAPDACIPPQAMVSWRAENDPTGTSIESGAELFGVSIANRPELRDLFVAIELEHMGPALTIGPGGIATGGIPSILYGLRFGTEDKRYEIRATSLFGGTFGLFDCTDVGARCSEIATLEGGYGTTGERVVISLPLSRIGLADAGTIEDVEAFSALGSYVSGAQVIYDRLRIR